MERVEHGTTLVHQAGTTMTEVVNSIKRVTDIMGEISAASNEQASGVSQMGYAMTQMDQVTQQNAALVEQMAAAASSLKGQAEDLVQVVATFKLGAGDHDLRTNTPHRMTQVRPVTAPKTSAAAQRLSAPKGMAAFKASASSPPRAVDLPPIPVPIEFPRSGCDDAQMNRLN